MTAASWLSEFALCLAAVLALPLSSGHTEDRPVASTATQDGKTHVDILSLKRTEGGTVRGGRENLDSRLSGVSA